MKCSICKNELVTGGKARLETMEEHCCNPNGIPCFKTKFVCINKTCPASISKNEICWNLNGEFYVDSYEVKQSLEFIDGFNSAIGSFSRKLDIECYKTDENFILIKTRWGKINVRYEYTSDEDGNILSRKRHFDFINKDGYHYTSGIRMLIFSIKRFHLFQKKNYGGSSFEDLKERVSWPHAAWWRRWAYNYAFCFTHYWKRFSSFISSLNR